MLLNWLTAFIDEAVYFYAVLHYCWMQSLTNKKLIMKQINMLSVAAIACIAMMSFTTGSISTNLLNIETVAKVSKVSWVKESHDFGEIPQGKPVSVEFAFTNNGEAPLLIADVATSCGCTASDYSKEPIAPGKSSKIKVTYNAANIGAFTKNITVNFSEAEAKKVLTIKGTVK
jgi:Protein of unknown function (DUF1573)